MPIGYGGRFESPILTKSEISLLIERRQRSGGGFVSFLRILTVIAEVGLSLVPGVGPFAQTGIALGAAGARLGLDFEEGSVNPVNVGIDFGAALIPGVGGGIRNVRQTRFLRDYSGYLQNLVNAAEESGKVGRLPSQLADVVGRARGKAGFSEALFEQGSFFRSPLSSSSIESASRNYFGELYTGGGNLISTSQNIGFTAGRNLVEEADVLRTIGRFGENTETVGQEVFNEDRRINKARELTEIEIRSILTEADILAITKLAQKSLTDTEFISRATEYLSRIGKLDAVERLGGDFAKNISSTLRGTFSKAPAAGKSTVKKYIRSLTRPNSKEFNDNFVQRVQLIFDGSDAGRAPIEYGYRHLKEYFARKFSKMRKIIEGANSIEDAFVKTGGTLVNSNVIIGYKLIADRGTASLIMINFYPNATKSQKNPNGKEPVFVFANKFELERLRERGMSYYLKKWATSKNGKVGRGFTVAALKGIGGLSAFLKINAIRNILSLASNISGSFVEGPGQTFIFTKGWRNKFVGSFKRNSINRTGRLLGRVLVGGAVSGFFGRAAGQFAGREAQRLFSTITSSLNNAIKGKQGTFGSRFRSAFRRQISTRVAASVQGSLRRRARKRGGNGVTQALAFQRKGGIIQRIPGSFSGGVGALSRFRVKV